MPTLLHLSDLHFGVLQPGLADSLAAYLALLPADVIVMSGDFSMRARPAQFHDAVAWLTRLGQSLGREVGGIPQIWVPGNHDIPLLAVWARAFSPLARYRRHVTAELTPAYQDARIIVAGVNTTRPFVPVWNGFWKDGRIAPADVRRLATRFPATPDDRRIRLLVTHHPFVQPPGHRPDGVILGGAAALPGLAAAGFDLLLAGHLHASYHGLLPLPSGHHALSIQAGTATSHRRRHGPAGGEYPNAFNLLRLEGDAESARLSLEIHAFLAGGWSLTQTDRFERGPLGWRKSP